MKELKVKRNHTKLVEVLFEACEIDAFVELDNYLSKHQVLINHNGTDRNVEKNMKLMKGDILNIRKKVNKNE